MNAKGSKTGTKNNSPPQYKECPHSVKILAKSIAQSSNPLHPIKLDRIKFLYSIKIQYQGKNPIIGYIIKTTAMEKSLFSSCDYIIIISKPLWQKLPKEHRIIQLEKLLFFVLIADLETANDSAWQTNESSYYAIIKHLVSDKYIESSEFINRHFHMIR